MVRYLLLRLLRLLFALWLTASGVFLLSRSLPADIILQQLSVGEISATSSSVQQQRIAEQRFQHRLGLDIPLFYFSLPTTATHQQWKWHGQRNQYHRWAQQLLHGNLGRSYRDGQPVTTSLAAALTYTLPLTTLAATVAILLAVWLATWLAVHQQMRPHVLRLLYALDALPLFVLGLLLLLLFANPDMLTWFPAYGLGESSDLENASVIERIGSLLYYLTLPLTCLILVNLPHLVVQLDAALQKERLTGYAVTARAKGAPEKQVVQHHTLRNALLPTLTQLNSLLPALVAGAVVVEVIFALPGVGRLLAEAAATHDYPMILGGVLLTALVRLLAQFLTDGLYLVADPRIRMRT
ncbi:ABC transporter permease [Hymenobacter aerilatus]|uniref:ABC transporter permease n=1 Tax=Hymenobacter aerilatus TaxID=2932251 RepID=A0A8T9SX05_9BACT|nr:ABC transporter permease [Hymenobacter aerilatus]UOR05494.1 ABC transporter permease [Hymenobacter aerilatus]